MTEFFTRLCHPNNIVHNIWSANSLPNAGPVTSREGLPFRYIDGRGTEERASILYGIQESSVI